MYMNMNMEMVMDMDMDTDTDLVMNIELKYVTEQATSEFTEINPPPKKKYIYITGAFTIGERTGSIVETVQLIYVRMWEPPGEDYCTYCLPFYIVSYSVGQHIPPAVLSSLQDRQLFRYLTTVVLLDQQKI